MIFKAKAFEKIGSRTKNKTSIHTKSANGVSLACLYKLAYTANNTRGPVWGLDNLHKI